MLLVAAVFLDFFTGVVEALRSSVSESLNVSRSSFSLRESSSVSSGKIGSALALVSSTDFLSASSN